MNYRKRFVVEPGTKQTAPGLTLQDWAPVFRGLFYDCCFNARAMSERPHEADQLGREPLQTFDL
jgi:hypothetical protein